MIDLMQHSPLGTYYEHCKKGELAYQVCTDDNTPVFFPRAVAPHTGSRNLEWRISKGLGTVYATTVGSFTGSHATDAMAPAPPASPPSPQPAKEMRYNPNATEHNTLHEKGIILPPNCFRDKTDA